MSFLSILILNFSKEEGNSSGGVNFGLLVTVEVLALA